MDDAFRVAQLAMMLSSDWSNAENLDAVYVHGLSKKMIEISNVFSTVVEIYKTSPAKFIAFNGGDGSPFGKYAPGTAWAGKEFYITELTRLGIPSNCLIPTGPAAHTGEEIEQLIVSAKAYGWKRIATVTMPYYTPRAACFWPKFMEKHEWRPDIYARVPSATRWNWSVEASQGLEETTPADMALLEASKVLDQIAKGYASPFPEVFKYLNSRAQ